jgi:hypothetical protein
MAVYVRIPNPQSDDEIATTALDYVQAIFPRWVPRQGELAVRLIEAVARVLSILWQLVSTVEDAIFRSFGPLVGIDPLDATSATSASTWTLADTDGHTIPAGTQVGIRVNADTLVPFVTVSDVTVLPGDSATDAGEVLISAVTPGAAASGLGGIGVALELIDPLAWVDTAVLTAATTGGVDAEADDDYMDRLVGEYQLLTRTPILPNDFVNASRRIAGVDRALALDLYNPADDTFGNERMVTVVPIDASGQPLSSGVKTALDASLQATREVNFVVNIMDATYTTIDVATSFSVYAGYSGSEVAARVVAALASYLSPANWGKPRVGDQHAWLLVPKVRYLELATLINNVEGVNEVNLLLFGASGHKNYAVVATTDVFTITGHGYSDGDPLLVIATTVGAPIAAGTVYYVRDSTTNTFKLAATVGGSAINITSDGSGTVQKVSTADITLAGRAPLPQPGLVSAAAA